VLRDLLSRLARDPLQAAARLIASHERIVLTGMGGSYAALLPMWRTLIASGKTTWHLDTAELLSLAEPLLTAQTLVIAVSQSGRSAELVTLVERFSPQARFLAVTNDPVSPLARASTAVVEIHAGVENAVSTRTYLNTLAALDLLTRDACGESDIEHWSCAADAIERYLVDWREHVETLKVLLGLPERLMLLARGDSMAAALYAGLIIKEAAKWPVEAMESAQFRHGPLELADSRLAALVMAGQDAGERDRNLKLAQDVERYGGRAFWLDPTQVTGHPRVIPSPGAVAGAAHAAIEAVPLQLLSVALAEQSGIEPGVFRHLQKVTTIE